MIIVAKNNTETILTIVDLGINILSGNQIDLATEVPLYKIAASDDLVRKISNEEIIINNGDVDLSVEDAIKHTILQNSVVPTNNSGKIMVHQTSRQPNVTTFFTGSGDNVDDIDDVGNGELFALDHLATDSTSQNIYMDFNIVNNITWIHEGYIIWKDADFDIVSLKVVPIVSAYESGQNTNYTLYGGYMVIPADGTTGDINITSDLTHPRGGLVYMPEDEGGVRPAAFWNATWDSTNDCFIDISPAPYGNGKYNIFTVEITLGKFVNRLPLIGSHVYQLQSADVEQLGQGMRFKCEVDTNGAHDWKLSYILTFHRERTV